MQVHSIVFAASGTLLLCCVDTSGVLAGMRSKIRKVFPGLLLQLFAPALF